MRSRDYRDVLGGLILIVLGSTAFLHTYFNYPIGTLRHLGPGMFPLWLGIILSGIGILIFLPAWFRSGPPIERFEIRPFVAIIGGGVAFAFVVTHFGMVPAVIVLTIASALADDKLGFVGIAFLSVLLAVITVAIFSYGLRVPLQPFRWPF